MQLTLLSPQQKKTVTIAWIEVDTPVGNFVIQKDHIPTILQVLAQSTVTMRLASGKEETFTCQGGILEVQRDSALLLLHE